MVKTVPESRFTEQSGLDKISQEVRKMGHLWRELTKDDYGIDGEIELLQPKQTGDGRETTGIIIKVQAKSGKSYISKESEDRLHIKSRGSFLKTCW